MYMLRRHHLKKFLFHKNPVLSSVTNACRINKGKECIPARVVHGGAPSTFLSVRDPPANFFENTAIAQRKSINHHALEKQVGWGEWRYSSIRC